LSGAVGESTGKRARKPPAWVTSAQQQRRRRRYQEKLRPIVASCWVWIAAVMGVYWERKAGPAAVAAMEELSAGISAS
jgi:hypothetical protein